MSVFLLANTLLSICLFINYFVADQEKERAELRRKAEEDAHQQTHAELEELEAELEEMRAAEEETAAELGAKEKELEDLRQRVAVADRRVQEVDDCLLMTGWLGLTAFLTIGILSWVGILARSPLLRAAAAPV